MDRVEKWGMALLFILLGMALGGSAIWAWLQQPQKELPNQTGPVSHAAKG